MKCQYTYVKIPQPPVLAERPTSLSESSAHNDSFIQGNEITPKFILKP